MLEQQIAELEANYAAVKAGRTSPSDAFWLAAPQFIAVAKAAQHRSGSGHSIECRAAQMP